MPNVDNSHLTAIRRNKLSAPTKHLLDRGLLVGRVLDFGCGRGFDCDFLGIDGYDPHWRPQELVGKYDTIFCNYVLNVLEPAEQQAVLRRLVGLLQEGGRSYIAVRADRKALKGWTRRGTYQCDVRLGLPLESVGRFRTYVLAVDKSAQSP